MEKKFICTAIIIGFLLFMPHFLKVFIPQYENNIYIPRFKDSSCTYIDENTYNNLADTSIEHVNLNEREIENILCRPNVLEYITFVQTTTKLEYFAVLIDEGDSLYSIEIYDSNLDKLQSISLGRRQMLPYNLRAIDMRHIGVMDIVVRAGVAFDSYEMIHGDMWDLTFLWIHEANRFIADLASFGVEFTHADGTALSANLITHPNDYPKIEISDSIGNIIQTIFLEGRGATWFRWIRAYDINNDGYLDLLLNGNDDRNRCYRIFIWDNNLHEYINVEFVGFDTLVFPIYRDGFVENIIQDFFSDSYIIQTLVWEGNRLIKLSEERRYFEYP